MADSSGPSRIETQLDPIFQAAIDSQRVPGVAAIALDVSGQVLFSKGYGVTTYGDDNARAVTTKSPTQVFSCTKLLTTIAGLQLIERQQLGLGDLVEKHIPAFANIQVLEKFDDEGKPVLRAPRVKAKVINLFTHTTGLTYDFFNQHTLRYRIAVGEDPAVYVLNNSLAYFSTPLEFDPGSAYEYGVSTDWLGLVIEKVSGLRVDRYIQQHIVGPLGLQDTIHGVTGESFFNLHFKDEAGGLTPAPSLRPNLGGGEFVPAGIYLTSTAEDYAQFLLTVLNYGTHPVSKVSILKPDTVREYIFKDQLKSVGVSNQGVGEVVASIPQFTSGGTFLPGITKGWSLGLLTNSDDLPNGRKAGSGSWAGLGNCYYWIDPASGKLGFLVGSCLPWFDRDHLHLFDSLERAVYGKPTASTPGEAGSNFSGGNWWKD